MADDARVNETHVYGSHAVNLGQETADVVVEACAAQAKFGDFASMHEGYGVLAEEVAELFEAVRMRHGQFKEGRDDAHPFLRRQDCIRAEAIQVAAVALRIAEQAGRVTR